MAASSTVKQQTQWYGLEVGNLTFNMNAIVPALRAGNIDVREAESQVKKMQKRNPKVREGFDTGKMHIWFQTSERRSAANTALAGEQLRRADGGSHNKIYTKMLGGQPNNPIAFRPITPSDQPNVTYLLMALRTGVAEIEVAGAAPYDPASFTPASFAPASYAPGPSQASVATSEPTLRGDSEAGGSEMADPDAEEEIWERSEPALSPLSEAPEVDI